MSKISIYLSSSLIIIATILGIGIGYYLTPQYSLSMYDKSVMNLGQPDKWLDLRYIDAMIAHHRGAMLLADKAKASNRSEIQNLTKEILENEPKLIAELYQWKKDWYGDSKKVTDPVVANLGSYDKNFDLRFLNALITHHHNGIIMTKEVRLKSNNSAILDNADAVEQFLESSGAMLNEWRKSWYSI